MTGILDKCLSFSLAKQWLFKIVCRFDLTIRTTSTLACRSLVLPPLLWRLWGVDRRPTGWCCWAPRRGGVSDVVWADACLLQEEHARSNTTTTFQHFVFLWYHDEGFGFKLGSQRELNVDYEKKKSPKRKGQQEQTLEQPIIVQHFSLQLAFI